MCACVGGIRAKFITGSVAELNAKPGGGHAWLLSLRDMPYAEASAALCSLPGVGPKVSAHSLVAFVNQWFEVRQFCC